MGRPRQMAYDAQVTDGVAMRIDPATADPSLAMAVLGAPDGSLLARVAVVQSYGTVGALLILGYERRWRRAEERTTGTFDTPDPDVLDRLLDGFPALDAPALAGVLDELEPGAGDIDDLVASRHLLEATFAVAARDGGDLAHLGYLRAWEAFQRRGHLARAA